MNDLDELARVARSQPAGHAPSRRRRPAANKVHQLIGGILIVAGFVLWIVAVKLKQEQDYNLDYGIGAWWFVQVAGVCSFVIGTVWYLGARLAGWWRT